MINVAICDDSISDISTMLELMRKYQEDHSNITLRIKAFLNGTELLELVREGRRFDVILIDVIMPEINGINLARVLRQYDDAARFILMSGSSKYVADITGICDGGHLKKPVSEKAFFEAMDKISSPVPFM